MIADALEAARQHDWAACLTALLAAWRPQREPELADLIDRVSARAPARPLAPTNKAIAARVADATEAELGPVCVALARSIRTRPAMAEHAVPLAKAHAPDPRIAQLLCALVVAPPYANVRGVPDSEILDALDAIDDPRFRSRIAKAGVDEDLRRGVIHPELIRHLDHLLAVGEAAIRRPPPPPLGPDTLAAVRAIDELLGTSSTPHRDTVLAAVYADPASTAARLVYADLLQDAGDPRGELIALQCNSGSEKRERELLKLHGRAWLGELEPLIQKEGLTYRRGFIATARLSKKLFMAAPDQPDWRTLEELDVGEAFGPKIMAWLKTLPVLRRVAAVSSRDLAHVGGAPWTALGVRNARPEDLATLDLPELRELDLSTESSLNDTRIAARGLSRLVERLRVTARPGDFHLPVLADLRPHARELEIALRYEFVRETSSVLLVGTHATILERKSKLAEAVKLLEALPDGLVTTATVPAAIPGTKKRLAARGVKLV